MVEVAPKKILLPIPRGLCAGVVRSVDAYDLALKENPGGRIYSVGEPAHNTHINQRYRDAGMIFVQSVDEVPEGQIALLGPHGTEIEQRRLVVERGLRVLDTTCPLVTKVDDEIIEYTRKGIVTIYWGDPDHQEAKAALSAGDVILVTNKDEAMSDKIKEEVAKRKGVAFASQTTFNADEALEIEESLRDIFPDLISPKVPDRCYATRDRQKAIKVMIEMGASSVVVVGSETSSNSKRLYEIAKQKGADASFVDNSEDLDVKRLETHQIIGIESGASVEEAVFQQVLGRVTESYRSEVETVEVFDESRIRFARVREVDYRPRFIYQS